MHAFAVNAQGTCFLENGKQCVKSVFCVVLWLKNYSLTAALIVHLSFLRPSQSFAPFEVRCMASATADDFATLWLVYRKTFKQILSYKIFNGFKNYCAFAQRY